MLKRCSPVLDMRMMPGAVGSTLSIHCVASVMMQAISQSMNALSTSTVDLMLLHAPGDPQTREETWRALEDAHYEVNHMLPVKPPNVTCSVASC